MTRTKESPYSPKIVRKAEKQLSKQALKEGRIDRQSIISQSSWYRREIVRNTISLRPNEIGLGASEVVHDKLQKHTRASSTHRNPGRTACDGWNSDQIESGMNRELSDIEDSDCDHDCDCECMDDDETIPRRPEISVALLEIAKPAKPKGVAKEFEVVGKLRNVIVLDDYDDAGWEDYHEEDWEDLYEESGNRRPYAEVLKAAGG